jgi:hypothetical protein
MVGSALMLLVAQGNSGIVPFAQQTHIYVIQFQPYRTKKWQMSHVGLLHDLVSSCFRLLCRQHK